MTKILIRKYAYVSPALSLEMKCGMKMNLSATIMKLDSQNNTMTTIDDHHTFQMGSKCNPSLVVCQPSGPADHFLGSVTQPPSITLKGASCGPAPLTETVYQAIKVTTMKTNM